MSEDLIQLRQWITNLATSMDNNVEPDSFYYSSFLQRPEFALHLVDLINSLNEQEVEEESAFYSACIFALEICVTQLQSTHENGSKKAGKLLNELMNHLAIAIQSGSHSLSFWLPILNAFYEVQVELIAELRDAYLDLAGQEDDLTAEEEINHLNAIRDVIDELSDLSVFDIAENFFAQSYAMPTDFYADLVIDLYSIEEGQDIALLMLLHPKFEVREVVVAAIEQLIETITLSSISLTRLQVIKTWYPENYHDQFTRWLKIQRKKGVIFTMPVEPLVCKINASEVDGSGAQGLFIHLKKNKENRLFGLLFKESLGIKDVWSTPVIPAKEVTRYYDDAFDNTITLRPVNSDYLQLMTNHFLAISLQQGSMPDLHLLEIQEILGLHFNPQLIDVHNLLQNLAVQISPFTKEIKLASLNRSKSWPTNKEFTESWYIENAHIDKLVNRCSNFVEGVRVCNIAEAMKLVFKQAFEVNRDKWLFHFLWITLWLKAKARKNEKIWIDAFFIAYAIAEHEPLDSIPLMHKICQQTVINSVETMSERRTHLNQE